MDTKEKEWQAKLEFHKTFLTASITATLAFTVAGYSIPSTAQEYIQPTLMWASILSFVSFCSFTYFYWTKHIKFIQFLRREKK